MFLLRAFCALTWGFCGSDLGVLLGALVLRAQRCDWRHEQARRIERSHDLQGGLQGIAALRGQFFGIVCQSAPPSKGAFRKVCASPAGGGCFVLHRVGVNACF